jgi:hypothetical protein
VIWALFCRRRALTDDVGSVVRSPDISEFWNGRLAPFFPYLNSSKRLANQNINEVLRVCNDVRQVPYAALKGAS